eukprot:87910-Amphidinium_carterae.1
MVNYYSGSTNRPTVHEKGLTERIDGRSNHWWNPLYVLDARAALFRPLSQVLGWGNGGDALCVVAYYSY